MKKREGFWVGIGSLGLLAAIILTVIGGRRYSREVGMEAAEAYVEGGMAVKDVFEADLAAGETSKDDSFLAGQILELKEKLERVQEDAKNMEARLGLKILRIEQVVESRRPQVLILLSSEDKPEVRAGDPLEKVEPEVPYGTDPFVSPAKPEPGSPDPFKIPANPGKYISPEEAAKNIDDLFGPPVEKKKSSDKEPTPAEPPPDMRKQA